MGKRQARDVPKGSHINQAGDIVKNKGGQDSGGLLGGRTDIGRTIKGIPYTYERNPEMFKTAPSSGSTTFRDKNLVGSGGHVNNADGSTTNWGSENEMSGGGTGSGLTGLEAFGKIDKIEGQSMDEVVYGVKKKGRKTMRRGLGE